MLIRDGRELADGRERMPQGSPLSCGTTTAGIKKLRSAEACSIKNGARNRSFENADNRLIFTDFDWFLVGHNSAYRAKIPANKTFAMPAFRFAKRPFLYVMENCSLGILPNRSDRQSFRHGTPYRILASQIAHLCRFRLNGCGDGRVETQLWQMRVMANWKSGH